MTAIVAPQLIGGKKKSQLTGTSSTNKQNKIKRHDVMLFVFRTTEIFFWFVFLLFRNLSSIFKQRKQKWIKLQFFLVLLLLKSARILFVMPRLRLLLRQRPAYVIDQTFFSPNFVLDISVEKSGRTWCKRWYWTTTFAVIEIKSND